MQVYKTMDIGTAKVTEEEKDGIMHYGVDIIEPTEEYNVTAFKEMTEKAMEEIYSKGKIPVITGGTGFYIQAVLYDISLDETAEGSDKIREDLSEFAEKYGSDAIPSENFALGFDAYLSAVTAIRNANTIEDKTAIAAALRAIDKLQAATGEITINKNGSASKPVHIHLITENGIRDVYTCTPEI